MGTSKSTIVATVIPSAARIAAVRTSDPGVGDDRRGVELEEQLIEANIILHQEDR